MTEELTTETHTCGWLVERQEEYYLGDEYGWELGELAIVPCGAEVTELPNGWECAAGHSHFYNVEYYDDDEIAGLAARNLPLAPNAARMDGSPIA